MKALKMLFILFYGLSFFSVCTAAITKEIHANDFSSGGLVQQGQTYFQRGAYEQAIEQWQAAQAEIGKDTYRYIDIRIRLGAAYQAIGEYDAAEHALQQALSCQTGGTRVQQALLYSQLGDLASAKRELKKAEEYLGKSLRIARKLDNPAVLAHALNNLGTVLSEQGQNHHEALKAFDEAAGLAETAGNSGLQIKALRNRIRIFVKEDNRRASNIELKKLGDRVHELPDSSAKAFHLLRLGELALRVQKLLPKVSVSPYRTFQKVLLLAGQYEEPRVKAYLTAYAKGYMGDLRYRYGGEKRYSESLQLTREAIFHAQEISSSALLYRWEWQRGHILQAQSKLTEATEAYRLALEYLQPIRIKLLKGRRDALEVFREYIRPVYYDFADVLLQQAAAASSDIKKKELQNKAIETIESLKVAELDDYFQDICVSESGAKKKTADTLEANTAVFYPIPLRKRIELLLKLPDGTIHQTMVEVEEETLKETVRKFQENLQTRTSWRYLIQSRQLYDWLITPIHETLTKGKIDTLAVVPGSSLRMIPLAALNNGKKYLNREFAVAVLPGLELTEREPLLAQRANILLNGLSESVRNFSPLPGVPGEISDIRELFNNNTKLLDQEFLLEKVERALQEKAYSIMHVASHGQFRRNPKETFLLTYDHDKKLTMDRLEKLLKINRLHDDPVKLLTLSACQTAVGDDRAALGLAGVALKAGAGSALASLWFVNDNATSKLVVDFYRQLLKGKNMTRAKALQQAQIALARDRRFRHPAYWASFLLIGNWL
ncbi:MAG: CHAT domain-containing protein [Gammaproteobacteria bacterium]|nr:CHAT domain-containing protein [Gammaproteobacteria bacterium]